MPALMLSSLVRLPHSRLAAGQAALICHQVQPPASQKHNDFFVAPVPIFLCHGAPTKISMESLAQATRGFAPVELAGSY